MTEELDEHIITFTIKPETYDYEGEDVVYRIILRNDDGDQLLIERAMPKLPDNGALKEIFVLRKISENSKFLVYPCGLKKVEIKSCSFDDFIMNSSFYFSKKCKTKYGTVEVLPNIK